MYPPCTVLVHTDLSEEDAPVLARAFELAGRTGTRLHLLHVFDSLLNELPLGEVESDTTRALRARMQKVAYDALQKLADTHAENGVRVAVEQRLAPEPAPAIVACACDVAADLIVMGTHGRGGLQRLLRGSVAETVTAARPCLVEVVRRAPEVEAWPRTLENVRERIKMAWV